MGMERLDADCITFVSLPSTLTEAAIDSTIKPQRQTMSLGVVVEDTNHVTWRLFVDDVVASAESCRGCLFQDHTSSARSPY